MTGRLVTVDPGRLPGWIERFSLRHEKTHVAVSSHQVNLTAEDGACADIDVGWDGVPSDTPLTLENVFAHVAAERRVAVLLARRAAHAVGLFTGEHLTESTVDTHYVQGKTKAGGWSQQRYARRRQNQADHATSKAVADVQRIIVDNPAAWDWFVTGGDAAAVRAVLRHLPELADAAPARTLTTPDPRKRILVEFPRLFRAVRITLNDQA